MDDLNALTSPAGHPRTYEELTSGSEADHEMVVTREVLSDTLWSIWRRSKFDTRHVPVFAEVLKERLYPTH